MRKAEFRAGFAHTRFLCGMTAAGHADACRKTRTNRRTPATLPCDAAGCCVGAIIMSEANNKVLPRSGRFLPIARF